MPYAKYLVMLLVVYLCQSLCDSAGDEDLERRKPMRYGKRDHLPDHRPSPSSNAFITRLVVNTLRKSLQDNTRGRPNGVPYENPVIDYFD